MTRDGAPPDATGEGSSDHAAIGVIADRMFRDESVRLRGGLLRILGGRRLEAVDDIVQETLLAALRDWRFRGVPDKPGAWLTRVAQRKAIDLVRRESRDAAIERKLAEWGSPGRSPREEERDDPIRLMLMCCHPALTESDRVLLTLSLVAGFGALELARAFLVSTAATEQRLVRAKRTLRDRGASMELPDEGDDEAQLTQRVSGVLDTLYLMLNEGYTAHAGDRLVRAELIDETRRLLDLLLASSLMPENSKPGAYALSALACFLASRVHSRTDDLGRLTPLEDQDRSRWDAALLAEGFWRLACSSRAEMLTAYGIEAAIAATHAAAPSFAETDWAQIVSLYGLLERAKPTPITALNKAVALAMRDGPEAGIMALDAIDAGRLGDRYHLVEATRGGILLRAGRREEAAAAFRAALTLPCTEPERAFLRLRLREAGEDA